jgi:hypothetical protein
MSHKRAKALRRQAKEQRQERERRAAEWSWTWQNFEGKLCPLMDYFLCWDGHELTEHRNWPTPREYYPFNAYEDEELVGTCIVEVRPISLVQPAKRIAAVAGDLLPFEGPLFHEANGHTEGAFMVSTYVQEGKPLRIVLSLMEGVQTLGLPAYGWVVNKRLLPIIERRYART